MYIFIVLDKKKLHFILIIMYIIYNENILLNFNSLQFNIIFFIRVNHEIIFSHILSLRMIMLMNGLCPFMYVFFNSSKEF